MKKIIFLLLICFVQNWFAQQTFKTSTKANQIGELLTQNKSVEWAIPISQSEKLTLQWSERKTSFTEKAGIRTFVGYKDGSFVATLSLSKTGNILGDFTWKESQWRITTSKDGYLSISKENHSGECGGCHDRYCNTHNENLFNKKQLNTFSATTQKKQIHTDNLLRTYRLAVLVDRHYYDRYGSKEAVRNFWSSLEIALNEYYTREIGIRFEIIDNDKLIIDNSKDAIFDGETSRNIIKSSTAKINELIGKNSYDVGIVIAKNKDTGIAGLAGLAGVNRPASKARAMANNSSRAVSHELGHLFGSAHTFITGEKNSLNTEPGRGQSIMSYGAPVNFFSLPSIYFIRETVRANSVVGTSKNNEAPVINTEKLREEYTLPKETFFQFKIDATDSDGDPLLYAFHQADIRKKNAQFESEKSTRNNTKAFYNHWIMGRFVEKKYNLSAGKTYTFWLGVNDTKDTYEERINHPTRYDMYETKVKFVEGTPFKITNFQDKKYKIGEKVTLTWDVDNSLKDHKVRILLSNDFGQTFNYILAPETENDGSHEIVMPNITIGRKVYHKAGDTPIFHSGLGLIKIEVIDHIAFALTNNNVTNTNNGGFEIENSEITFTKTPPTNIKVPNESSIPDADIEAISSCPANNTPLALEENTVRHQNFITRTWTAKDSCGNTSSFVQHIEIDNTSTPPVSPLNFITPLPQSMNISCSNEYSTTPDEVRVEGGKSPSVAVSEKRENLSDGKGFIITRTWVATDEVAESISHTQTITLRDEQAPVLSSQPENMEVYSENEVPQQQILTATDCGEDVQVSSSSERTVINGKQTILYHWEATDKYSNTTHYTQTITINEANSTPTPPTEKQSIGGRVGINTDTPQATLDVRRVDLNLLPKGQPQGVSFPNFTTEKRNTFDKSKIKEGTMIYNTTEKCLEIFLNNEWKCLGK